jgi:outer membrane protein assembly factor BamD
MRRSLAVFLIALTGMLAGCGMFGDKVDKQKNWTAEQYYRAAKEEFEAGNYQAAVKLYESLEAKFPFGRFAQQAQIDVAYAYYKDGETAQAIAACDRFMKLHPNHPNLDYAIYLKALAYFKLDRGFLGAWVEQDLSERDPKALRESFDAFKGLVERFPQSIYADDSRARMAYLVNTLARHEVNVASYYFNRGAYLAAANRAQSTLQRYPQAPANEDALVMMIRSYEKMGMNDLAADAQRVLEKNFPRNRLSQAAAGQSGKSWWKFWQ